MILQPFPTIFSVNKKQTASYPRKDKDKKRNDTGKPKPTKEKIQAPIISDGKSVFISSG
jgi:hypothetical protein